MTDPGAAGDPPRSGSGCGVAFGIGLILAGGVFLWVNLTDTPVALLLLDALPLAAVWWPLLLVVWGAWKVVTRLRTGRAGLRFGEVFVLLLFVLGGTVFTLAQRAIESQGLERRLTEVRRLVEQQSEPFPVHVFVTEESVSLSAEGEVEILISLPAGNLRVEAAAATDPGAPAAPDPEPEGQDGPGGAGIEGRLRLVKRVWATDGAAAAARAEAVRLRTGPLDPATRRFPVRVEDSGTSEVALELLATLPPGVRISAFTDEGWVRVYGPFARVEARTNDGPVEVRGTGGPVSLTVRNGAAWASGIEGALAIESRRAPVEVDGVAGTTTVDAEGAPVWIAGAESSVTVRGRNAPVAVEDSFGPIEIETRIAPIRLERIGGSAVVRSEFGDVVAMSVEGPLEIRTDSADLEVRRARSGAAIQAAGGLLILDEVAGPLTVTSGRGEVRASRLSGPADFTSDAGGITVRGFGHALSVTSGDAEVDVATDAIGGEIGLVTERGDVRLALPAAGSFSVSAETRDGDVDSEFTLERRASEGASRWEGRAGSGAERVTISTREGDITLRARPPAGERR
ncbi:MAG: DUF4097 domain-containing protein [Acidobacteria bacterium]|nr:DUF4097 domain-containing protein [Acidobacteriota bacterium]